MKSLSTLLILAALLAASAFAQVAQPPIGDDPAVRKAGVVGQSTTKISEHVWEVPGYPNCYIVVGSHATLVVDTGVGPRNGATIARLAATLSNNQTLFLTSTHFHPEHSSGEPGFPPGTILIRDAVQQQEMNKHGVEMVDRFHNISDLNKELLAGVVLRPADVTFDQEATLDLGGVTARLLWFGGTRTKGDELIFVEPDRSLITGPAVANKALPGILDGGTPTSWLAVLDKAAALNAVHVLPDHTAPGDGSLVTEYRSLILDIQTRALALKRQGVSADDAGKQVSADLKTEHPDWPNTNAAGFVKSVYADPLQVPGQGADFWCNAQYRKDCE